MDEYFFNITLCQINFELCERCKNSIKKIIESLDICKIEQLFYENKYYHKISDLAIHLVGQSWFTAHRNGLYRNFLVAYDLEQLLKNKTTDKNKIVELVENIIMILKEQNHNCELTDAILNNFFLVLKKNYPEHIEAFIQKGYSIINDYLEKDLKLSPNLLLFHTHNLKCFLNLKSIDSIEFFYEIGKKVYALMSGNKIRINLATIDDMYNNNSRIITSLYLLFGIGHELEHSFIFEYDEELDTDEITKLRVYNSKIGQFLSRTKSEDYYLTYHAGFAHEHDAHMMGLHLLYQIYKYLPGVKDKDKQDFNRRIASRIFNGCKYDLDGQIIYMAPVEFTKFKFSEIKEIPQDIALYLQKLANKLNLDENKLSETQKFILGYNTPYIGILGLISDGIVSANNLFEDLPILYENNQKLIDNKFTLYYSDREKNRK